MLEEIYKTMNIFSSEYSKLILRDNLAIILRVVPDSMPSSKAGVISLLFLIKNIFRIAHSVIALSEL